MNIAPWVEKYRPNKFDDIVLESTNKQLLKNIIKNNNFPNLLFYGPPGTGKTTTIINLIEEYQKKYKQKRKGLKIHLNASDDRGIDIIRNQINQFVNTKTLFGDGIKFVILDEVDYMTKNAQTALKYLIQQYSENIRFCLICNYISRIDLSLQNEFIRLRFCQLPKDDILSFLNHIVESEKLNLNENKLQSIQKMFKSDIRSMINYIQSNHYNLHDITVMIDDEFWEELIVQFKKNDSEKIKDFVSETSDKYNIQYITLIKQFINYLLNNKPYVFTNKWLDVFNNIIHNINVKNEYLINYSIIELYDLFNSL
uniref:AAA+ ATPase domain-containing protein n=1 Tax=viral metagenome TaxID=1070528 RepID=A0A6C0CP32_9ZZZZ